VERERGKHRGEIREKQGQGSGKTQERPMREFKETATIPWKDTKYQNRGMTQKRLWNVPQKQAISQKCTKNYKIFLPSANRPYVHHTGRRRNSMLSAPKDGPFERKKSSTVFPFSKRDD
jgi:hypothetical protein